MEYVFPAIFNANDDGSITITFPDLPGCISEGKSLSNALYMSHDALTGWLEYLLDEKEDIPAPSEVSAIDVPDGAFVNLVYADVRNTSAVKRTVSLPQWLDDKAQHAGISYSRVLQDALKERLG